MLTAASIFQTSASDVPLKLSMETKSAITAVLIASNASIASLVASVMTRVVSLRHMSVYGVGMEISMIQR